MAIKSDKWITKMALEHRMIEPFVERQARAGVVSYGVSSYGYDVRVAVRVPLKVVGLELPHEDIRGRLDHAVTRGREDDLRAAAEWLAVGRGSGFEDLILPSDRPVSTLAAEVLDWLGWV